MIQKILLVNIKKIVIDIVAVVATLIGPFIFYKRKGALINIKHRELSDSTFMNLKN